MSDSARVARRPTCSSKLRRSASNSISRASASARPASSLRREASAASAFSRKSFCALPAPSVSRFNPCSDDSRSIAARPPARVPLNRSSFETASPNAFPLFAASPSVTADSARWTASTRCSTLPSRGEAVPVKASTEDLISRTNKMPAPPAMPVNRDRKANPVSNRVLRLRRRIPTEVEATCVMNFFLAWQEVAGCGIPRRTDVNVAQRPSEGRLEYLDPVVGGIGDINPSGRLVDHQAMKIAELPGPAALLAPHGQMVAILVEYLDTIVPDLGDIDIAILVDPDAGRSLQLTGA